MRPESLSLLLFVLGCSSASTGASSPDAGGDSGPGTGDDGGSARADSGPKGKSVCAAVPAVDGGALADGGAEGSADAGRDAVAPVDDGGTIHCTKDVECPTGSVCDTRASSKGAGTCVSNAGAAVCAALPDDGGGPPGTCAVNEADMCCTAGAGCLARPPKPAVGGGACCPGAAGDAYCQKQLTDPRATCAGNVCTTCLDSCVSANPGAYARFLGYQVGDCGCLADGACYADCHESTTRDPSSTCGQCLAAETSDGLNSTCTLAAAADCASDPLCSAFQACAGKCPM